LIVTLGNSAAICKVLSVDPVSRIRTSLKSLRESSVARKLLSAFFVKIVTEISIGYSFFLLVKLYLELGSFVYEKSLYL